MIFKIIYIDQTIKFGDMRFMKFPIGWHQRCLINKKDALMVNEKELSRLQETINRQKMEIEFYELQIETAIKERKDGFNEEVFLRKRKEQKLQE
jgi:hypothetical protein